MEQNFQIYNKKKPILLHLDLIKGLSVDGVSCSNSTLWNINSKNKFSV
ncbi:hypothetical protein [Clostridium pasteurianum]